MAERPNSESLRERKRRQTFERISEVSFRMFAERGYAETTLEAVAEAAGISARTLYYYFKTKDDLIYYLQANGFVEALGPALSRQSTEEGVIRAILNCLLELVGEYDSERALLIDRIVNSTEGLRRRELAIYLEMENTVFDSLSRLWPGQPEMELRIVAMAAMGSLRLAMTARREDPRQRPIAYHVARHFFALENLFPDPSATISSPVAD